MGIFIDSPVLYIQYECEWWNNIWFAVNIFYSLVNWFNFQIIGEPPYSWRETRYSRQSMYHYIDGLVQERRNPSALAMELRLSCTN